jgi:hypothetical protein
VEDNPLYNKNTKQLHMPKPAGWSRQDLLTFLQNKTIKLGSMDMAFIHSQIYLYSMFLTRELKSQELNLKRLLGIEVLGRELFPMFG